MQDVLWNFDYEMCSTDGGRHWRSVARHAASGEVYILEQDAPPGYEGNYTALIGPLSHPPLTHATLARAHVGGGEALDQEWIAAQTWLAVPLAHDTQEQ